MRACSARPGCESFAALPPDDRATLEKPILVSSWYEGTLLFDLMKKMVSELNQSPEVLFTRMGIQSCDDGMNTVYKIFFKIGAPSYILNSPRRCGATNTAKAK